MKKITLLTVFFIFSVNLYAAQASNILIFKNFEGKEAEEFLLPRYKVEHSAHFDLSLESMNSTLQPSNEADNINYILNSGGVGLTFNMEKALGGIRFRYGLGNTEDEQFLNTHQIESASISLELSYRIMPKIDIYFAFDLYKELVFKSADITYSYTESNVLKYSSKKSDLTMRSHGSYFGLAYRISRNIILDIKYSKTTYKSDLFLEIESEINNNPANATGLAGNYQDQSIILGLRLLFNTNL